MSAWSVHRYKHTAARLAGGIARSSNAESLGGSALAPRTWKVELSHMVKPAIDFHSLSIPDRLALVEQIWDSIAQDTQSLPLTPEQREELERRWAEHERDPASAIPWEQVRAKLYRRGA